MPASHRILLTGTNSYIASHILSQLLATKNYSVRAVVRSQSKVDAIKALLPNASAQQLDFAVVPDITVANAFDTALQSSPRFDTVMHTSSPILFSAAASRVARDDVKSVIITSSFAAVGFHPNEEPGKVYTEDDWNPVTLSQVEAAWAEDIKDPAYLASKTFAEPAAWDFVEERKAEVKWDFVTLNPPMVYGPLAHKISSLAKLSESTGHIYKGFFATKTPTDALPPDGLALYVDVRDLTTAHISAMEVAEAGNQRFGICGREFRSQELADLFRNDLPGVEARVPKGRPGDVNKDGTRM
ncbi:NAD(P)-binding protein [Setomelanomma holmii]|uniref:NAD(P)-binding protein n=1 Tax=Setomelanomma holmii TaxID=210430 RepID=A0A9P4HFM7_9PLEO|nr:NAD(P)-binding protein [Setomelanomma holmii]